MSGKIAAMVVAGILFSVGGAYAQDREPKVRVWSKSRTLRPARLFLSKGSAPSFGN